MMWLWILKEANKVTVQQWITWELHLELPDFNSINIFKLLQLNNDVSGKNSIRSRVQKTPFIREKQKYQVYSFHFLEKWLHFYKSTAELKVDSLLFWCHCLSKTNQPTWEATPLLLISFLSVSSFYQLLQNTVLGWAVTDRCRLTWVFYCKNCFLISLVTK